MNLKSNEKIGLHLAAALYIEDGGISYEEMRAIPFFTDETDIKRLYRILKKYFYKMEKDTYSTS